MEKQVHDTAGALIWLCLIDGSRISAAFFDLSSKKPWGTSGQISEIAFTYVWQFT
jgi:hypothetical protein